MTGPRKPRASISITLLEDPDYVMLMASGDAGLRAIGLFLMLVVKAKALGNDGKFKEPLEVIATMLRTTPDALADAIAQIERVCRMNHSNAWVQRCADGSISLPSFGKWNAEHGGAREGAGRPAAESQTSRPRRVRSPKKQSKESSGNLDSILITPLLTERNVTERDVSERTGTVQEGTGEPTPNGSHPPAKPARPRDPIWDCVIDRWFAGSTTLTKQQRGRANAAVGDLRQLGATPEEIAVRANRMVSAWGEAACTPQALANHWHQFDHDPAPKSNGTYANSHDARKAKLDAQIARVLAKMPD